VSDTPRTDAASRMAFSGEYMVPIEDAQKLERELAEAKKLRDTLAEALASLLSGVKDGWFNEGKWWHTGIEQAEQALAATKGGQHE